MREFYIFICRMTAIVCFSFLSVVHAAEDRVALVVNDEVITSSELQKAKHRMQQGGMFQSLSEKEMQKQLIDYVINERIELQQAKLLGLTVSDKELDQALQRIADANHIPLSTLYQSVEQTGLSLKDYREEMKKRLIIQKLAAQHITKPPKISEQEVTYFMKKQQSSQKNRAVSASAYQLLDYLIPVDAAQTEEDRKIALKNAAVLRERVMKGQSLTDLKYELQDLGMRSASELPDEFLRAAQQLKPNEFSEPIVAANGVHVLKLLATNVSAASAPSSLTREQAKQMVLEEKLNEMMQDWVRELRAQSYIEIKS